MKLYKTTATKISSADETTVTTYTQWTTSGDGASKLRTAMNTAGCKDMASQEIDVPTTRTKLVAFLDSLGTPFVKA